MEYGCFRKYMPPHSPPYIKSIKWQAENAYAVYDDTAENIMTTEQLHILQRPLYIETIHYFYKGLP